MHVSNLPLTDKPISIGWMISVVSLLPEQASRWILPLDFQRIASQGTTVGVAIDQLRRLKLLFGSRHVSVVADRWYGTPETLRACRTPGYCVLIRLQSNRTLYRQAVRRFTRGRPPHDDPLLQGTRVCRRDDVHFQQDRDLVLSVIRVEQTSAWGTRRDPRVNWFLTLDTLVPLEQVPQRYSLRFSEEHLFRLLKQDALWLAARVRTPEHILRWSWIVALAFLQMYLACPLGLAVFLPWEAKGHPVTPRQPGTPVRTCQPRGKAPGRTRGFRPRPAPC